MSVAFIRDVESDGFEDLPDRPLSPHRNLVTAQGLAQIEAEVERLQHELAGYHSSPANEQTPEERAAAARIARDLRYWTARRSNAEIVPVMERTERVHFGSAVTLERENGRKQTFRIVGEDEADPTKGLISYIAPLAQALTGRRVGDVVPMGGNEVEIKAIH